MEEYKFTQEELKIIEENAEKKHRNWEWVYGTSPEFNITREKRFTNGKIQLDLDTFQFERVQNKEPEKKRKKK